MKTLHLIAAMGAGICLIACGADAQPPATMGAGAKAPGAVDKNSIVQTSLIADTTAIKPGTTFTLGVLYKMQPEWHIYWKNPGASGFATTVEWGLPPGASSSDTLYPAPLAFESPGNITSFGYEKETLLMVEVQAAQLPENGKVELTAKSRWLMCSDRCIPNSNNNLTLSLPIGEGKPANEAIFAKYRKHVPKPAADLPSNVEPKVEKSGSSANFTITITPPEGKKLVAESHEGTHAAYFYPNDKATEGYVVEPPAAQGTKVTAGSHKVFEGPAKITWKADPDNNTAEPLKRLVGTLVYQTVTGTTPDEPVLLEIDEEL